MAGVGLQVGGHTCTCGIVTLRSCRTRWKRPVKQQVRALLGLESLKVVAEQSSSSSVTWQVAVGTIAGITPFVVAGIEFSKRIAAQKKCTVCKGSGLVQKDEYYFRCYSCGGFLPWQSWRRFFSGR